MLKKLTISTLLVLSQVAQVTYAESNAAYKPAYKPKDKQCLQAAILAEARGTNQATMQNVADVVVNRARIQSKSVCSVLKQPKQFAKFNHRRLTDRKNKSEKELEDLENSSRIASATLAAGSKNKQILFFHTKKKNYAWTRKLKQVKQDKYHRYYAVAE